MIVNLTIYEECRSGRPLLVKETYTFDAMDQLLIDLWTLLVGGTRFIFTSTGKALRSFLVKYSAFGNDTSVHFRTKIVHCNNKNHFKCLHRTWH